MTNLSDDLNPRLAAMATAPQLLLPGQVNSPRRVIIPRGAAGSPGIGPRQGAPITHRRHWPGPAVRVGPNRWRYSDMEFWPEAGGIYLIDHNPPPGDRREVTITLPHWRDRLQAFIEYLAAIESQTHIGPRSEVQYALAIRSLVRAMQACAEIAARQGDLTDPKVQRYYREQVAPVKRTFAVEHGTGYIGGRRVIMPD